LPERIPSGSCGSRFQADAFNIFNHANFTGLNTDTTVSGFGSVTGSGPGRNLQLASSFVSKAEYSKHTI
jgi:hypothetical protein